MRVQFLSGDLTDYVGVIHPHELIRLLGQDLHLEYPFLSLTILSDDEEKDLVHALVSPLPLIRTTSITQIDPIDHRTSMKEWEWLAGCIQTDLLTHWIRWASENPIQRRDSKMTRALVRNPHSLVVEWITKLSMEELEQLIHDTHHDMFLNPSDEIIDLFLTVPFQRGVHRDTFAQNINPRAPAYLLETLHATPLRYQARELIQICSHPFASCEIVKVAWSELFRLYQRDVDYGVATWEPIGMIMLISLSSNPFLHQQVMEHLGEKEMKKYEKYLQFEWPLHLRHCSSSPHRQEEEDRKVCEYILSISNHMQHSPDVIWRLQKIASISDSDVMVDFLLSPPIRDTLLNCPEVMEVFLTNPHPRAVEWSLSVATTDVERYMPSLLNNPHPLAVERSIEYLLAISTRPDHPRFADLFRGVHNPNPHLVLSVLEYLQRVEDGEDGEDVEDDLQKPGMNQIDLFRLLSTTDRVIIVER